jgi:UDP-4-amino-4-deoxy-L-arabinose formyltransferase/UDP-glucuronic acid dehydrogenase (UDP-4-keto-hexauronic acid decarboxylating)
MRSVVFAYHNMGICGLEALKEAGFNIAAIFSHEDDPGENCWFDSVVEWANENHIEVFCPPDVNTPDWKEKVSHLAPDVIFSFYFRHMLSHDILKIPASGAYNLHGSLLPAYRGRTPVNWAIVNGEKQTGVTLHYMTVKPDAGDIVGQKAVEIEFEDTARTLYDKLCGAAREMLAVVLPLIRDGRAPRVPQDLTKGSYYSGRRPEDGRIDWSWPAMRIYNLIRAVTEPYPGAFGFLPGAEKILIWWALPEGKDSNDHPPGRIEVEKKYVFVRTGDGRLKLIDIEVAGSRMKRDPIFDYFKSKEGLVLT